MQHVVLAAGQVSLRLRRADPLRDREIDSIREESHHLLAHRRGLFTVSALFQREFDLLLEEIHRPRAKLGGHVVVGSGGDSLSVGDRVLDRELLAADVLALVRLGTVGLDGHGVTDALAKEHRIQPLDHESQHRPRAAVLLGRDDGQDPIGIHDRFGDAVGAYRGVANYAVEALERARDAARCAKAIRGPLQLSVDVLVGKFDDGLLDREALPRGKREVRDHFQLQRELECAAALEFWKRGSLGQFRLGERLE